MDKLIKRFDSSLDADLRICAHRGVAYQANMGLRIHYDEHYLAKVMAYEGSEIARAVNDGRVAMVLRHLPPPAKVIDWGAGSGAFMKVAREAGYEVKGYDVNHHVHLRLNNEGAYAADPYQFDAVCLWDTIEHMDTPEQVLRPIKKGSFIFVSVPIFNALSEIRASKHYRPREHLYYWTDQGFVDWMALWGFRLLERSDHEVSAGRESIGAYAFRRDLPDYHDHIAAYRELHDTRHYGDSATEEYLGPVAEIVKARPVTSILDFACGRSDIAAHFWRDGERRIAKYDPAIGKFKVMPDGRFDLVLCCDLMEHIPMLWVDQVLFEVKLKGDRVFFGISTKPARAKLPDGRNAHVTLLTKKEWTRWIASVFGPVKTLPSKWDHELVLLAGP